MSQHDNMENEKKTAGPGDAKDTQNLGFRVIRKHREGCRGSFGLVMGGARIFDGYVLQVASDRWLSFECSDKGCGALMEVPIGEVLALANRGYETATAEPVLSECQNPECPIGCPDSHAMPPSYMALVNGDALAFLKDIPRKDFSVSGNVRISYPVQEHASEQPLVHGFNCPKVPHDYIGVEQYEHLADNDGVYHHHLAESVPFCGRCHQSLAPITVEKPMTCVKFENFQPLPDLDKTERGIYEKFNVSRTDGKSELGQKHHGCEYFVLDMTHDPFAIPAIQAYGRACYNEYPALGTEIFERWAKRGRFKDGLPYDEAVQEHAPARTIADVVREHAVKREFYGECAHCGAVFNATEDTTAEQVRVAGEMKAHDQGLRQEPAGEEDPDSGTCTGRRPEDGHVATVWPF